MFQAILETAQKNIDTIRCILKTNQQLREIIYSQTEDDDILIKNLRESAPHDSEWQVFDHCASVMRLYAIYEQFVEDLIRGWLEIIPKLYPKYAELPNEIRIRHQWGVGKILIDFKKHRYKNLSLDAVISGLFNGVTEQGVYELLPDAFLIHEQNLRENILEKLLKESGVDDTREWLKTSRHIKRFFKENPTRAEAELNKLIDFRNDAAHRGTIDNVLGLEALLELCDFMEALSESLTELVTCQVIQRKKIIKQATKIGQITEWFPKPKAAVLKSEIDQIKLSIETEVFLTDDKAYCQTVKIKSIHIKNTPCDEIQTTKEMEIGLTFGVDVRKNLNVYIVV